MKISTTAPKANNRTIDVEYPFEEEGDDALEKNAETFGKKVVNSLFLKGGIVDLQAVVRRALEKGSIASPNSTYMSDEEVIALAQAWRPGVATVRKTDKAAAFLKDFEGMDAEAQAKILEQMLDRAKAKAQAAQG